MMRHVPGVGLALLLCGVFAALAYAKADSLDLRRAAFAAEAAMRFWPEVLWRGSWLYPWQRAGMFGSYGLVQVNLAVLLVTVGLLVALSAQAVRLAGAGRMLLAFLAAWALAPVAAAFVAPEPFGGASGAVLGIGGAALVWAIRCGDRDTAGRVGLLVVAGIAGFALAGGQAVALDAAGLAVGALAGLVLKPKGAAPGDGA
jgi:hypothetical protein